MALVSFALAAVALVTFIRVERRSSTPMLPTALFRSSAFSVTGLIAAMLMLGLLGAFFLLTLYFGSAQHLSIIQTGWRLLALLGVVILTTPVYSRLAHRLGPRYVLTYGLVVTGVGLYTLTGLDIDSDLFQVGWRMALVGFGMAAVFAPMTAVAVASAPPELAGMAGAANSSFRQTGGALGPAIFGAIITGQATSRLSSALAAHHVPDAAAARVMHLFQAGGAGAVADLPRGPHHLAALHAGDGAFMSALHTCATIGALAMVLVAALGFVMLGETQSRWRSRRRPPPSSVKPAGANDQIGDPVRDGRAADDHAVGHRVICV